MKPTTLELACHGLDQLVYKTAAVHFPDPEEDDPEANTNRLLYEHCFWTLGKARHKSVGGILDTQGEVKSYDELLNMLECTIPDYPIRQDAIKMLNACETVLDLLKEST